VSDGGLEPAVVATPAPASAPASAYLSIRVTGRDHAIAVTHVREVMRVAAITRVPHSPPHVRGITALRGRLIPVVDLGIVVAGRPATVNPHARIVVVAFGTRLLGLLVDRVGGVVTDVTELRIVELDALARAA
jgi:purine-binding chemotaxis protein CheW